ncbi:MAG: ATP-binding protein [Gemmatimonadaceae bacterium]
MPLSTPFRVLLVDDDQLDRMAVRRALLATLPAVSIIEVEDLASGMRELLNAPVDCIILDYHLPDGLGLDLLMHVRAASKSLPVLMLTGVVDAQTAVELMKAGATDYIPKSQLSAERLERSLRYAMRIRAADERIRRYTEQLHALSGAALRINAASSVDCMLQVISEEARKLVEAERAIVTVGRSVAISVHENHAAAAQDAISAEFELPLLARDGTPLGALQLNTKPDVEFTESDRAIIVQLAQLASGAIENARLLETAQAATQARDDMLAIVSHDLRNPVQTIVMATTLLLELAPADDRRQAARKQVEIVLRSASRANRLIDDLLDATRIDAGTFSIEVSPTRVEPLMRDAIDLLTPLAAAAQVELTHSLSPDMPLALVDSQRVLQVFSNLGGNAIKFTPRGGRVLLAAAAVNGSVCLTVTDSGRGIASDDLTHIFERFWQAHGRERLGAGLGLWIAKGIVEAHGGQIEVESEANVGTTVRFTLPAL